MQKVKLGQDLTSSSICVHDVLHRVCVGGIARKCDPLPPPFRYTWTHDDQARPIPPDYSGVPEVTPLAPSIDRAPDVVDSLLYCIMSPPLNSKTTNVKSSLQVNIYVYR